MKKLFIPIILLLIICAAFAYRYFLIPKRIEKNYTAKLSLRKIQINSPVKKTANNHQKNIVKKTPDKPANSKNNILKNSDFSNRIKNWHLWRAAKKSPENIKVVDVENNNCFSHAVRIENPDKQLIGVSQVAMLTSGTVYRLSGAVRSLGNNNAKIFGGRIALYLPPQKEKQIVWMTEYDKFWEKELIFTNLVTGPASIYFHLGYGGVATTGEFTNIKLEKIEQRTKNKEQRVTNNKCIWEALKNASNNSKTIIEEGKYVEKQCDMMIPLATGLTNLQIYGLGKVEIIVNMTNVSWCNECAMNIPDNVNLVLSNVTLRSTLKDYNTHRSYNINLNGSSNALIIDCKFESEIYGTNNNFKNFIATEGAKNVLVKKCGFITSDVSGSNWVWHCAAHDAQPIKFEDCKFFATNLQGISVGKSEFLKCKINNYDKNK